jgi:DNA polymerase III epsilon subunit-like protein
VNYLWFDCETTGLDSIKNDVVQVAFIPVINGIEKMHFNQHCQPIDWNNIDPQALQINGLTIEKLKTFQTPHELVDKLVKAVKQYGVKFTLAGYNVPFDRGFLSSLFTKVGREDDFVALFNPDIHDVLKRAKAVKDQIASTNLKLATLATYFNIPINAHSNN